MAKYVISKAVGIDLGTTNSAVAIMKPTDTEIALHSDAKSKHDTTPSCVWKDPRSGQIAVGRKATTRIGTRPSPIRSIKRSMGRQTTVHLTNEDVSPERVSAAILSEMKHQIEEDVASFATHNTEWIVDRAIVTVPAYFDQPQIEATRKAAEMAGLQVLELLHEPTAAACHYCWETGTQNGVFMVYDIGGGTFDVSILRCIEGAFEVLGIDGNKELGGDDMDTLLAEDLRCRLLAQDYELDLNPHDAEDKLRIDKLKLLAERVKKGLSAETEYTLLDAVTLQDKSGSWVDIDLHFERHEFEALIRPTIERTLHYCHLALEKANKKAGITLGNVDAIILAGGTTHIPLIHEVVRSTFCSILGVQGVRAKCTAPIYKKVDTIVALGAAIRAAATGGLVIYNPERTVRVSFRGISTTANRQTHIGGQVEALKTGTAVAGGHVRLTLAELSFEDEQPIKNNGSFSFTRVPLQPSAENMLTFEIYDSNGHKIASVNRPISQSKEARPTGGSSGTTSVTSKAYSLEVSSAGQAKRKELIPAMETLPTKADYTFYHPGNTALLRLPLYQNKKKIQEITITVDRSLPKGVPISFKIEVDELSGITVTGNVQAPVGEIPFEAALEIPAERAIPSEEEFQVLEEAFQQAVDALPAAKKNIIAEQYQHAKNSYESALKRQDMQHAVHEFEEIENLIANNIDENGPLQPPKEFFDRLVKECLELAELVTHLEKLPNPQELTKAIEDQRQQGNNAYAAHDSVSYTDAILKLNTIYDHLVGLVQKLAAVDDTRTDQEKAQDSVRFALEDVADVNQLIVAGKREDLQSEIALIGSLLRKASQDIQSNPQEVRQKVSQARARLQQIKNILMGSLGQVRDSKLVEE